MSEFCGSRRHLKPARKEEGRIWCRVTLNTGARLYGMHRMYAHPPPPKKNPRPHTPTKDPVVQWHGENPECTFVNRVVGGLLKSSSAVFQYTHPGKIKRREVKLDPQVSPEEIMSRKVELGCKSWTSFASGHSSTAVQRTLSLWLCPARQLKEQLRSALVAGQWRGDTALTLPLFWRQSMVSPVFSGQYPRLSLHSLIPFPPVPVPNKQPCFCGRKATWSYNTITSNSRPTLFSFPILAVWTDQMCCCFICWVYAHNM